MDIGERAAGLFGGHYCAEAVLTVLARELGVDSPLIPRIATGLCSGMSRTSGTCGAVTGAIMAISLASGRDEPDAGEGSREELEVCYAHCQELVDRFMKKHGSTDCTGLTGCDLSTPEGQLRFREEGRAEDCRVFVADAVRLAAEILRGE